MLTKVLDWIYPPKCGLCARFGPQPICPLCFADFVEQDSQVHESHGPVSEFAALFKYETRAAQAVRRLKYSRITSLIDPLSSLIVQGYKELGLTEFELIVPIPIHWRRRAWRGFNQAEALASKLPKNLLQPNALHRVRATTPQARLNREQRTKNLIGAFQASPQVAGKSVLLIDDVRTSGHTAEQCAGALLGKGATRVGLLTLTSEN